MDDIGTLRIRTYFTLAVDEHGRESGKWLTVLTRNAVNRRDAGLIFDNIKSLHPSNPHICATFTIQDHLF